MVKGQLGRGRTNLSFVTSANGVIVSTSKYLHVVKGQLGRGRTNLSRVTSASGGNSFNVEVSIVIGGFMFGFIECINMEYSKYK